MADSSAAAGQSQAGMFALLGPDFLANPYPFYERLRNVDCVQWVPGIFNIGAWLVTRHAFCAALLRNKHFGKEADTVLPPEKLALIPQEREEIADRRRSNMLFRDPPVHTRLRALVSQAFTPRTIDRLRPHIAGIAEHLLDQVEDKGQMDLIRDFAFPLPIIVIAELLGVPPEDRDRFKAWSTTMTAALGPAVSSEVLVHVAKAIAELDEYLGEVIEDRRRTPRADLITELAAVHDAGDKLSKEELLSTCRLLLNAGHETTVNLIGNGTLALLRNPEPRAALAADPSLLPNAVEELLRYDSPVQMTVRFTFEDSPLGNHTVRRGDLVVLLLGGANRDPEQFPDPNRLDIARPNASTHLSFGGGIHYCLGASLARLEGEIAIGALLRRLPQLSLATEELQWRDSPVLHGLSALPVTF
jgi:pimeloyl-[acyl-carrier protein] synthase